MKRKNKEKLLKIFIPLLITAIIIWLLFICYIIFFKKKELSFLETIDTSVYGEITYEVIYGIHFNMKGNFEIPENVSDIKPVLTDGKMDIDIPYEESIIDNKFNFTTSSPF